MAVVRFPQQRYGLGHVVTTFLGTVSPTMKKPATCWRFFVGVWETEL